MGLRSLVKNSGTGMGLQTASAEEASAQGAATLSQASAATGLPEATTALSATQQGASPSAAKMVGTPNQQAKAVRKAVRSISDAKSESQIGSDAMAALQRDPVRAEAMARMARLPGMVDLISKRVQEQALTRTSPLGDANWQEDKLLAAAGGDAARAQALKADIVKLTSNAKPDVATVNRLMTALGVTDGSGLQGKLGEMVKDIDPAQLSRALLNGMGSSEQAITALDDADAKVLGYNTLDAMKAEVEKLTGKPFAGLKVSDVLASIEGNKKAAFADVAQLRSTLADPTASGAQRAAAADAMRRLGFDSGLAQEKRAGDLQAQAQSGDTVRLGKLTLSVDQLTKDPTLLADVQRVLDPVTGPEYRAELLKQDPAGNKPYVDWALKNATALEPYIAKAQDDITAQKVVQDEVKAKYGPVMNDVNANLVFKALGVDLSKLHDTVVDPSTLPPLGQALFRASDATKRVPGNGKTTTEMDEADRVFTNMSGLIASMTGSGDPRFRNPANLPVDLLEQLSRMPGKDVQGNFNTWLAMDRASSVYANAAPKAARPTLPRPPVEPKRSGNTAQYAKDLAAFGKAKAQYDKDFQKYNTDMVSWTKGNNSRNAVVAGVAGQGAVAALGSGVLTDPAYKDLINQIVGAAGSGVDPADKKAFVNAETLQDHMNQLAKTAAGGGTLAEKIAAQKRLQNMGAALTKLDPGSDEFKAAKSAAKVTAQNEEHKLFGSSATKKPWDDIIARLPDDRVAIGKMYDNNGTDPRKLEIHADSMEQMYSDASSALTQALQTYQGNPKILADLRAKQSQLLKVQESVTSARQLATWARQGR